MSYPDDPGLSEMHLPDNVLLLIGSSVRGSRDMKAARLASKLLMEGVGRSAYRMSVDITNSLPYSRAACARFSGVQELWVYHELSKLSDVLSSLPALNTLVFTKYCPLENWQQCSPLLSSSAWSSFLGSVPTTLCNLQLPYQAIPGEDFNMLVDIVQRLPNLRLALTGFICLEERQAHQLASIVDRLCVLRGVSFRSPNALHLLLGGADSHGSASPNVLGPSATSDMKLRNLRELEVVLDEDRSEEAFEQVMRTSFLLSRHLASLTSLVRLTIWEYACDVGILINGLRGLPYLSSLGLACLHSTHCFTDSNLYDISMSLPGVTHLTVDRLVLKDSEACFPQFLSLDVGFNIQSYQRLGHVLPNVQTMKIRWTWEQAIRKLAGSQSITDLSLGNLGLLVDDLVLIRTLRSLRRVQVTHGRGLQILSELFQALSSVPALEELSIIHWRYKNVKPASPRSEDSASWTGCEEIASCPKYINPAGVGGSYSSSSQQSLSITQLSNLKMLELNNCSMDLLWDILPVYEECQGEVTSAQQILELRLGLLSDGGLPGQSNIESRPSGPGFTGPVPDPEMERLVTCCLDRWSVRRLVLNYGVGLHGPGLSGMLLRRPEVEVMENPSFLGPDKADWIKDSYWGQTLSNGSMT